MRVEAWWGRKFITATLAFGAVAAEDGDVFGLG